jgi:hypothetical protein
MLLTEYYYYKAHQEDIITPLTIQQADLIGIQKISFPQINIKREPYAV